MDPKHLVQLSVIFEKGSLTAAAKHLLIAQPTLTRNMATLEMQAGAALFQRSRYGVRSTLLGEALAREGRAIAHNMHVAAEQVQRFQIGLRDHLRIGTGPLIGIGLMPRLMERMLGDDPRVSVSLVMTRPQDALDQLMDGTLDVVIAPAPHNRPLPGVTQTLLADDRMGVFCGVSHPLARKKTIGKAEFQAAEWLSFGMPGPYQREVVDMLTQDGITGIRTRLVTQGEAYTLIAILSGGHFLAVLPRLPMSLTNHLVTLVELPSPGKAQIRRPLYFWSREMIADDPVVRRLHDTARSCLNAEIADATARRPGGAKPR